VPGLYYGACGVTGLSHIQGIQYNSEETVSDIDNVSTPSCRTICRRVVPRSAVLLGKGNHLRPFIWMLLGVLIEYLSLLPTLTPTSQETARYHSACDILRWLDGTDSSSSRTHTYSLPSPLLHLGANTIFFQTFLRYQRYSVPFAATRTASTAPCRETTVIIVGVGL
jgi:hypothetical protein